MAELEYALNLDAVGIFWVAFCCSWTAILAAGMAFLWRRRDMPLLKIRGITLSLSAITCLHAYWMAVQFAYIVNPFPEKAEYWLMGIYLPCGIALFHASNSRFLFIAREQRKFVHGHPEKAQYSEKKIGPIRVRLDHTRKVLALVSIGMFIQLLLTATMYLLSKKFHPSFGLPGTGAQGSPWDVNTRQKTGWEWWPSLLWQFFWSWVVAPVVLWRARRIHDTLGWRTQTIACCLAGLPATPMWLVALYVPAMAKVNKYFIAPQWIAVSIMVIEIFTVFLPCWQAYKHQALRQETLDMIAAWESRYRGHHPHDHLSSAPPARGGHAGLGISSSSSSSHHGWTMLSEPPPYDKPWLDKTAASASVSDSSADGSLLSMGALERLLEHNPEPLRQFSALKDFSGENVAFLAAVARWKKECYPAALARSTGREQGIGKKQEHHEEEQELEQEGDVRAAYTRALEIYARFVSPRHAEFPINISFQEMAGLEAIFEGAARVMYGERSVAPWNGPASAFAPHGGDDWPGSPASLEQQQQQGASTTVVGSRDCAEMMDMHQGHHPSESREELHAAVRTGRVSYYGDIPEGFGAATFDQVENSIKYLVLTNTWPKFLQDSRRSWNLSSTAQESVAERGQGTSLGLRFVRLLSCEI